MRKVSIYPVLLSIIEIIGTILLFFKISTLIPFIGDQGWFYLAARDLILGKHFPLVGIPTSHPWLHQGPFWTYLLAIMLWLFKFNPVSGSFLSASIGVVSIYLIYRVGALYFSKDVGIIASFLYATSPLVIITERMAYHTSPIPLFTLLFLSSLYNWLKDNAFYFPLCIFFLAVLYNFELATITLTLIFLIIVIFGLIKKSSWIQKVRKKEILVLSFLAFLVPLTPMFLYDLKHGFPQTFRFMIWLGYHLLLFFGYPSIHSEQKATDWGSVISFAFQHYQLLIFAANSIVAGAILVFTIGLFYRRLLQQLKQTDYHLGTLLLGFITGVLLIEFFATRTTSDAYLIDLFPPIILLTAVIVDICLKKFFLPSLLALICLVSINVYTLVSNNYFVGIPYSSRVATVQTIIKEAHFRKYTLKSQGPNSQFSSFTMNYQYLAWYLGHSPSTSPQALQFFISELNGKIILTSKDESSHLHMSE